MVTELCSKCTQPYRRIAGGRTRLCEAHYQEWVASRCKQTVVTYDGMARYESRCSRKAQANGRCWQHKPGAFLMGKLEEVEHG